MTMAGDIVAVQQGRDAGEELRRAASRELDETAQRGRAAAAELAVRRATTSRELEETALAGREAEAELARLRGLVAAGLEAEARLLPALEALPAEPILSHLTARDLLRLRRVSRHFSARSVLTAELPALSIPGEAARQFLVGLPKHQRGWLPAYVDPERRQTAADKLWYIGEDLIFLQRMLVVEMLQMAPAFAVKHAEIELSPDGAVAIRGLGPADEADEGPYAVVPQIVAASSVRQIVAASSVPMEAGCHFAQFSIESGADEDGQVALDEESTGWAHIGVMRPKRSVLGPPSPVIEHDLNTADATCFYYTRNSMRTPYARQVPSHEWAGMTHEFNSDDSIGLKLDLDAGSMTVFVDGRLLGVMQAEGLSGPLCWAAVFEGPAGDRVHIGNDREECNDCEELESSVWGG